MRRSLLLTFALVAGHAVAGCSDDHQATVEYKPPTDLERPKAKGKAAYVSGADDFAKRLADKQARDKAKADKK